MKKLWREPKIVQVKKRYVVSKIYQLSILKHLKKPLFSLKMATYKTSIIIHFYKSQCIRSNVLPSMRKDRVYTAIIILNESTACVESAHRSCPAGLSACCNHIQCNCNSLLPRRVHLFSDKLKGCTDRLQTWNKPRNGILSLNQLMK